MDDNSLRYLGCDRSVWPIKVICTDMLPRRRCLFLLHELDQLLPRYLYRYACVLDSICIWAIVTWISDSYCRLCEWRYIYKQPHAPRPPGPSLNIRLPAPSSNPSPPGESVSKSRFSLLMQLTCGKLRHPTGMLEVGIQHVMNRLGCAGRYSVITIDQSWELNATLAEAPGYWEEEIRVQYSLRQYVVLDSF